MLSDKPIPRILIVDDDPVNCSLLTEVLKSKYAIESALNGYQALEMLETKTFDLVILDLIMPAMDGFQTLQALKTDARYCNIPVIIASAVHDKESVIQCIKSGADDYLLKPYELEVVRLRVQTVLEQKYIKGLEAALEQAKEREEQSLMQINQLRSQLAKK